MSQSKEDPVQLALRARPRAVTRLNRRTLSMMAVIFTIVVTAALLWAFRSPSNSLRSGSAGVLTAEHVTRAEGLGRLPRDYGSIPKLGPPLGELGRSQLNAEHSAGLAPLPEQANFRPNPEEDALRAERLRRESEDRDAIKAQVFTQLRQRRDPHTAEPAAPAAEGDLTAGSQIDNAVDRHERDPNHQTHKEDFLRTKAEGSIYASGILQTPRSPYQLMAGTVIPAALWTAINSDLPGQVIATVTENLYDTVTGRILLIPQGARLLGQYDSQVAFGQQRVLLVWTRLIMPDGSSIVLDRIPGVDTQGHAGLEDAVNWHWGRIFEGAALSTLIGATAELAVPQGRVGNGPNIIIATRESLQGTVNQVGQELIRRNLDVQSTLAIRRGFPVRAIVQKDLVLKPYAPRTGETP